MAKHHDQATKEQILLAIKNGESVASVSTSRGISTKTIYAWLRGQADNTGTSSLEIAKLRRENQELKEIIGWFTLKEKRAEKKSGKVESIWQKQPTRRRSPESSAFPDNHFIIIQRSPERTQTNN